MLFVWGIAAVLPLGVHAWAEHVGYPLLVREDVLLTIPPILITFWLIKHLVRFALFLRATEDYHYFTIYNIALHVVTVMR